MNIYSLVFLILVSINIFAKDTAFSTSVSLVGMSMDYREYDLNGQLLDSEESSFVDLAGVDLNLEYTIANSRYSSSKVKVNFMILGGETKYVGSYINSGLPYGSVISSTQNSIIDTDITYKRSEFFKNSIELIYGIGLGYREWERALSASQVEVYSWFSIRPTVGVSGSLNKKLKLGILVEYQYGFETKMSASNLNHTFTLGGADILEVSFPVRYMYSKNIDFFFEAILQKQIIVESDRLYTSDGSKYYYEPESTAYNNYLKFGVGYKF